MDAIQRELYAEFLENEIQANLGKSKDVDWLAQYPPLLTALQDAKPGRVDKPRDIGLGRWELERNRDAGARHYDASAAASTYRVRRQACAPRRKRLAGNAAVPACAQSVDLLALIATADCCQTSSDASR